MDLGAALHKAAEENDVIQMELLISQGVDVDHRDRSNQTPLIRASSLIKDYTHQTVIYILLKNGANPNAQDNQGNAAVHYLASMADPKVIELLLHYKAEVDVENEDGETPLFRAVRAEKFEVVKLLNERGADVNKLNSKNGSTPLHVACNCYYKTEFKIMYFLIDNGANINTVDQKGRIPIMGLIRKLRNDHKPKVVERNALKFLLNYSDFTINTFDPADSDYNFLAESKKSEFLTCMLLEHLAKWETLKIPFHENLSNLISKSNYSGYYRRCLGELQLAKKTKFHNSWVTFLNLEIDGKKKLKYYAGNEDLVRHYNRIYRKNVFSIYRPSVQEDMRYAIEERKHFDESTENLTDCLPIFNPTHLVIRDILDLLTSNECWRLNCRHFYLGYRHRLSFR